MPRFLLALLALALIVLPATAEEPPSVEVPAPPAPPPEAMKVESADNPLAIVKTSMGDFVVEFFVKEAPKTVESILGLAEGTKAFKDPVSGEMVTRHYYDGLTFHRVIDNFMIQGGCPLGTGSGGPGDTFANEINGKALGLDKEKAVVFKGERMGAHPHLLIRSQQEFTQTIIGTVFKKLGIDNPAQAQERQAEVEKAMRELTLLDVYEAKGFKFLDTGNSHPMKKGTLAMANAGPGTNGSQFYVNLKDNLYLNGKHTVFGHVVKGMDVVERIGKVKVDKGDGNRPLEEVKILSIRRYVPASE